MDSNFINQSEILAPLFILGIFFIIILVIFIIIWLYTSFAYVAIGKKLKIKNYNVAFIPGIGPTIIAYKSTKNSYWPWKLFFLSLILILCLIISSVFVILFLPSDLNIYTTIFWIIFGILICVIMIISIIFSIYTYIWQFKMYEVLKRPGWWALVDLGRLISVIPILGAIISFCCSIMHLILLGIVAFSKEKVIEQEQIASSQ